MTAHQNRDANAEGLPHTALGDNAVEQTHHIGLTRSEPEPQHKGHDKKRSERFKEGKGKVGSAPQKHCAR